MALMPQYAETVLTATTAFESSRCMRKLQRLLERSEVGLL